MLSRCTSKYFQVISEFKARKLLYQSTAQTIPIKGAVYCGFDPTAHSLHLGNFISILNLARLAKFGFQPIAIVGGATVQLGDPSFKAEERQEPDLQVIAKNTALITQQLESVYSNIQKSINQPLPPLTVLNNSDFYKDVNLIEFISKVGRKFRMNALLNKEHIRRRVDSEDGLSLTEFFYTILQSYDFAYLSEKYDCTLQIGGSDQWGNITNGCDFVRREYKKSVYGITTPLLVDKNGQKFGKSEGNALFLNKESEFAMKQYLLNLPDDSMEDYLKQLTFLSLDEIKATTSKQETRGAQNQLISELMAMIYGQKKENKNQILYELKRDKLLSMTEQDFEELTQTVDQQLIIRIPKETQLIDILTKFRSSKSEIRRLIEQGGLMINGDRISTIELLCNKYMLVKLGKRDVRLLIFI